MNYKIEQVGNYILIKDENNIEVFKKPINRTFFFEQNSKITVYSDLNDPGTKQKVLTTEAELLDKDGVAIVGGAVLWLSENTGFNAASGGSGAHVVESISGNYDIDAEAIDVADLTLTGNTTVNIINLPEAGKSKTLVVDFTGAFTLTDGATTPLNFYGDIYDGTKINRAVILLKSTGASTQLTYVE